MQYETNQSCESLLVFFNDTKKRIESLLFIIQRHLKIKANKIITEKYRTYSYVASVANFSPETSDSSSSLAITLCGYRAGLRIQGMI